MGSGVTFVNGPELLASELSKVKLEGDPAKWALEWMAGAGRDDPALLAVLNKAAGIEAPKRAYSAELIAHSPPASGGPGAGCG